MLSAISPCAPRGEQELKRKAATPLYIYTRDVPTMKSAYRHCVSHGMFSTYSNISTFCESNEVKKCIDLGKSTCGKHRVDTRLLCSCPPPISLGGPSQSYPPGLCSHCIFFNRGDRWCTGEQSPRSWVTASGGEQATGPAGSRRPRTAPPREAAGGVSGGSRGGRGSRGGGQGQP